MSNDNHDDHGRFAHSQSSNAREISKSAKKASWNTLGERADAWTVQNPTGAQDHSNKADEKSRVANLATHNADEWDTASAHTDAAKAHEEAAKEHLGAAESNGEKSTAFAPSKEAASLHLDAAGAHRAAAFAHEVAAKSAKKADGAVSELKSCVEKVEALEKKFNPNHDERGRFASGEGGSAKPNTIEAGTQYSRLSHEVTEKFNGKHLSRVSAAAVSASKRAQNIPHTFQYLHGLAQAHGDAAQAHFRAVNALDPNNAAHGPLIELHNEAGKHHEMASLHFSKTYGN
jgi:hypothetical protein